MAPEAKCDTWKSAAVMLSHHHQLLRGGGWFWANHTWSRWEGHQQHLLHAALVVSNTHDTSTWKIPCQSVSYRARCWLRLQVLYLMPQCGAPPSVGFVSAKLVKLLAPSLGHVGFASARSVLDYQSKPVVSQVSAMIRKPLLWRPGPCYKRGKECTESIFYVPDKSIMGRNVVTRPSNRLLWCSIIKIDY